MRKQIFSLKTLALITWVALVYLVGQVAWWQWLFIILAHDCFKFFIGRDA